MKKLLEFAVVAVSVFLTGCLSTQTAEKEINPAAIEYKEISAKDYCDSAAYQSGLEELWSSTAGFKVTDAFIVGSRAESKDGNQDLILKFNGSADKFHGSEAYCLEYLKTIAETKADAVAWAERVDSVKGNSKFNGHYTFYLYKERAGNFWAGYHTKVVVYNIEGIPTQEQIDADKAERIAKEEAERKAKEEAENQKKLAIDNKGKILAKGYVYHGTDEDKKNSMLFANGALEEGHAYYISSYMVSSGGSMGGAVTSIFTNPKYHYVDYASQKVKGEVVAAGNTAFGNLNFPVSVVVAGGKPPMNIPVVLGVIEED